MKDSPKAILFFYIMAVCAAGLAPAAAPARLSVFDDAPDRQDTQEPKNGNDDKIHISQLLSATDMEPLAFLSLLFDFVNT